MATVKKEILNAIEQIKTIPVDDLVLKETKDRIKYSFAMSMDSPDAIANSVSMYVWVTGEPTAINRSYEMFDSVTVEDLQRVAKKYLVPNAMTIATISPDDKPVLDWLFTHTHEIYEKYDLIPVIYFHNELCCRVWNHQPAVAKIR